MRKSLSLTFLSFAFAILGTIFPSCSSNENNDIPDNDTTENVNQLLGTWRYDWGDDPLYDYTLYSFFDNGSGIYFDKGNGARSFLYNYDTQRQEISIIKNEYSSSTLIVKSLNQFILEIYDAYDHKIETYRRSELTYDMMILGEWYLHVAPATSDNELGTRVLFRASGNYEAKDYNPVPYPFTESYYSFSSLKGIVKGTWSIKNNIISISGPSQIAGRYIIDGLVINGIRLIRADYPDEYPYLVGGWHNRGDIYQ